MKLNIASNHPKTFYSSKISSSRSFTSSRKRFFSEGVHLEEHRLTAARCNCRQPNRAISILEHGQCQTQAVAAHHAVPFKHTDTAPGIALFEITACL